LQITSGLRLTETDPRTIPAWEFLSRPIQDLSHFFFGDAMIENVRRIGLRINPEAQLHSVILFPRPHSSLLCIEPS
jgi:hypothetical protein